MEYRLEELCNITSSKRIYREEYVNYGIPFYRGKEIIERENGQSVSNELFITEEKYNDILNKYGVPTKGDILITAVGTIGISYLVGDETFYFKDGNLIWLKEFNNKINNEFLSIYLKTQKFKNDIEQISIGSTQKAITIVELKRLKIDVPPIEIQNKIVKIYNSIDQKIELNNQMNENLQKLLNTVFTKWFCEYDYPDENGQPYKTSGGIMVESELGEIPENCKVGVFQDIIDFSNGYGFKSNDLLDNEEKETYKVFKQGNINLSGGINEEKTKSWFYKEKSKGLERFILKKGDILMCMTDIKNSTYPLLGHTALMNVDDKYIVNQRVGLIRCKKEITDYPYVYTMSNLEYFLKEIRSRANSGVQVNLSTKGICETKIVIPDKMILDKFNEFAVPLYETMFKKQKENATLEQLRDTLLPKLMNGAIDLDKIKI